MRKSVAIGIAGLTAVIVATWRQIQRDTTLATDLPAENGTPGPSMTAAGETGAARPATDPGESGPATDPSPGALFTPSVSASSTKAELYKVATDLGIEGRSKMNKAELLDAIRAAS